MAFRQVIGLVAITVAAASAGCIQGAEQACPGDPGLPDEDGSRLVNLSIGNWGPEDVCVLISLDGQLAVSDRIPTQESEPQPRLAGSYGEFGWENASIDVEAEVREWGLGGAASFDELSDENWIVVRVEGDDLSISHHEENPNEGRL